MSKTQLYLGTNLLDFNGEYNVKRQVTDFRDLALGASNKSYTIDIPLTRVNKKLLKLPYDVRSKQEVSDEARIVADGIELIKGKFRLLTINESAARGIIEADDWMADLSGLNLNSGTWASSYEHLFTSANIVASWSAAAGAFYRYPLINWGELYSEDYGATGSKVYPYDFYPMFHVGSILEKHLADAGYVLAANGFFASTVGNAMYILGKARTNVQDFLTDKGLSVYVDDLLDNYDIDAAVAASGTGACSVTQVMVMNGETLDEGDDFSGVTHEYDIPEEGTYRLKSQIKVFSTCNSSGSWTADINIITWSIRKNGTPLVSYSESDSSSPTIFDTGNVFNLDTGWVHLLATDDIDVHVAISAEGTNNGGSPDDMLLYVINGAAVSFLENTWDERNLWPGIGMTISPYTHFPDMTLTSLMKSMKEIFNLRLFMDKNNRTLYIEESDDFYGSSVVDWSDKIDYSEPIELEVIAANYKENRRMKYKNDPSDNALVAYIGRYGFPNTYDHVFTSEYIKPGLTILTSNFAPCVQGFMSQIGHYENRVPRIYGDGEYVSATKNYPQYRAKSWEPRLLLWGGLFALNTGNFDYHDEIEDASGTNYTTFPKATTYSMTTSSGHWWKDFRRIEEAKILTCTLKLSPAEINKFVTVVGTAANEGFRAAYQLNVDGNQMYFICTRIITDGSRVKAEFIQKI